MHPLDLEQTTAVKEAQRSLGKNAHMRRKERKSQAWSRVQYNILYLSQSPSLSFFLGLERNWGLEAGAAYLLLTLFIRILSREHVFPTRSVVKKCRKICGLGCVNRAHARTRVTQPSPHIFLHICIIHRILNRIADSLFFLSKH